MSRPKVWFVTAASAAPLLAVALLLAPTFGGSGVVLADATAEATAMPWNLLDCFFALGTATIPKSRLAPYMPSAAWGSLSLVPGVANVGFEIDVCAEGSGLTGQVAPQLYASTWTVVAPPPSHRVPGFEGDYFVNWDVLVPDADRRGAMVAAGAPARDGTIAVVPNGAGFRADYELVGNGRFAFDVVERPGTNANIAGEFAQFTPSAGKLTFWRTHWATSERHDGVGLIHLDPASWQAQAFGATTVPATFVYGKWAYTDGEIVLPE